MFPVLCAPRNIHTTELSSFSSQYLCACARVDLSLLLFLCLVTLSNANKREKPRFQVCSSVQASFLVVYTQRTLSIKLVQTWQQYLLLLNKAILGRGLGSWDSTLPWEVML